MTDVMTKEEEMAVREEVANHIIEDMESWGEEKFHKLMENCLPCCLKLNGEMNCLYCPNYPKEKGIEEINKDIWVAEVCVFTSLAFALAFEGLAEKVEG